VRYPEATRLLITADGGGSNGSRVRLWKRELQKLANELGLDIVVSHLPPGTPEPVRRMVCVPSTCAASSKSITGHRENHSENYFIITDFKYISCVSPNRNVFVRTSSSAIPKIEGDGSPTHLLFFRLTDDFLVHTIWLYDWQRILQDGRFKVHRVRNEHRSYIFNVNERLDGLAILYERPHSIRPQPV
jgi:DDE family transposase